MQWLRQLSNRVLQSTLARRAMFARSIGAEERGRRSGLLRLEAIEPRVLLAGDPFTFTAGALSVGYAVFYAVSTWSLAYGTERLGVSRTVMLVCVMAAVAVKGAVTPFAAMLGDRYGRRPLCLVGCAASAVIVVAGFGLAVLVYRFGAANDRLETSARPVHSLLVGVQRVFDSVYNGYVANVQQRVAELLGFLEHLLISGLAVRGSAALAGVLGIAAKSLQTGNLHGYVYWFFGGLLAFWLLAFGF